jgi:hypothetical protein
MALTKVSSNLVADDAIVTGKIADGGVGTADLAANAVTTAKIAQNNVTAHHIADGSVTTTQLGADAVTAAKVADDAISEEHLDKTIISDMTAVTPVAGDFVLLGDTSDSNNLKKSALTLLLNSNVDLSSKLNLSGGTMTGVIQPSSVNAIDLGANGNEFRTLYLDTSLVASNALSIATGTDLTLDAAGDLIIDVDGDNVWFDAAGTRFLSISQVSSDVYIGSEVADKDIFFRGKDASSTITALTLDMSDAGTASFNNDIKVADDNNYYAGSSNELAIYHTGSGNSIISHSTSASGAMYIDAGGTLNIRNSTGGGENMIVAVGDGAVTLYHNNAAKLATASGGVNVTGNLASSSIVTAGTASSAGIGAALADANVSELGRGYISLGRDDTADAAQISFSKNGSLHSYLETRTNGLGFITDVGDFGFQGGKVGIGTPTPTGLLHVDGHTSSVASIFESNGSGDTVPVQLKVKANNGTTSTQGLYGNAGSTQADNTITLGYSGTNGLSVDSAGKVGIGTIDPQVKFHIVSTANTGDAIMRFQRYESDQILNNDDVVGETEYWANDGSVASDATTKIGSIACVIQSTALQSQLRFKTYNASLAEHMRLYGDGQLVIGNCATPPNGSTSNQVLFANGQSTSSRAATNLQTHKSFMNPNGTVGTIKTTGSATQFNTSSDYRLKENVVTDWDGTTLLKQLKPSKFNFKADADTTIQGFLAHEVSSIVPQAISGTKDSVYTEEEALDGEGVEGQPNYQGIDHSHLVPLLVKTVQELEARIKTLEG